MNRRILALTLPVAAAASLMAAYAGGWATITVADLPDYVIAKQPTNLTFSVRQHGLNLLGDVEPFIVAQAGDAVYKAKAVATNRAGFYTAKLDLPSAGDWTITIKSGFGKSNLTLMPIAAVSSQARAIALPESERGQRLFVAKGCVSCHVHDRVKDSGVFDAGPNLSTARFASEYLAKFLADPAVKTNWTSGARMPNLELKSKEIGALVAFLNEGTPQRQAAASH